MFVFVFQPGIAASVVYRDQVIFSKGFGVKDKTKPDAPDESTIFRIGSVSKVFAVSLVYYIQVTTYYAVVFLSLQYFWCRIQGH